MINLIVYFEEFAAKLVILKLYYLSWNNHSNILI